MTSAYILILAILFLGGLLAVVGDRVGTRVGRARLRLFNLRPRKTATIVAVFTGTLISASTLSLLFALSETLRDGVFRLDGIQKELRVAESDLGAITEEKEKIDQELSQVSREKLQVERDFKQVRARYGSMTRQAGRLRKEVQALRRQRERLLAQIPELQAQVRQRDEQIASQDSQLRQRALELQSLQGRQQLLQAEVSERDRRIQEQDQTIAQSDQELLARAEELQLLQKELRDVEENLERLKRGEFAIVRGAVLTREAFIAQNTAAARVAIATLLNQANQRAFRLIYPTHEGPVDAEIVGLSQAEGERLVAQISDSREYVVRIRSLGNYLFNQEDVVRVFADVTLNEVAFQQGEVIAAISLEPDQLSDLELGEQFQTFLALAQFRARQGVLGEILIGDGQADRYLEFLQALRQLGSGFDQIQAIALNDTKTAGPLRMQFVVLYQGQVVLRS
ncbi:MAG: DUF3084 domain-containing protein [Spirulina sp. SIO3F2]|nr:DUF3084 domain-containing protein [Spirulina sp. SIO3F2]